MRERVAEESVTYQKYSDSRGEHLGIFPFRYIGLVVDRDRIVVYMLNVHCQ